MFDSRLLGAALDGAAFPVLDEMMEYFAPGPPFLTFGAPGAARALSMYGRTVLADRDPFADPFGGSREEGIEIRVAGPEDPMVFPPRRFGLVHCRWMPLGGSALRNLIRWLKPGGVLLVEQGDDYPARNLPHGPYRSVSEAVADRIRLPGGADLPALLIRHGLTHVGCRHQAPSAPAFHVLLQHLVERGAPWPELTDADLSAWPHDPVAQTPGLANVTAWGLKNTE